LQAVCNLLFDSKKNLHPQKGQRVIYTGKRVIHFIEKAKTRQGKCSAAHWLLKTTKIYGCFIFALMCNVQQVYAFYKHRKEMHTNLVIRLSENSPTNQLAVSQVAD